METTLTLPPSTTAAASAAPVIERTVTTRVQALERADHSATLPANKPFVAQVVSARLSGVAFPENAGEIAPEERTLRPYGVPMLPYDSAEDGIESTPQADVAATDTG